MLGKHYLCAVVTQDAATNGQAAPATSNTSGSRQGLWLTPRANEPDSHPNFAARNADCGAHCHGTLSSQAKEMWPTITAHTHQVTKQWATPRANERDGTRTPNGNPKKDGIPLGMQAQQWATPNARDPKGAQGRMAKLGQMSDLLSQTEVAPTGQWNRANGKLNPRWVETLMGLPIGWTMPSCMSPQTIELMSCDSSAMELCQPPQSELSEFSLAS